jgi:hypothetical protein
MNRRPTRVVTDRPVTTRTLATAVHEAPVASSVLALAPCASHVAKRRAVARVRIDDACGARWPHEGRLSGMPIESACGGAVGTAWRPLSARSGSSREFPIAGDRPWIVKRSRGQSSVVLPLMLPSMRPGLGATLPPRNRVRACEDEAQSIRDPAQASPGMPPQPRGVTGRPVRVRSRTAPSLIATSSVAARTSTPMRLSHAAPGYLNPGTREGLAPNTPEGGIACLSEQLDPNAHRAGQTPGEPAEIAGSLRVTSAATLRDQA